MSDKARKKQKPLVIPASTRPIKELIADRVTILDGSIGVKIAEETPLEEVLRIMDWATAMNDHIGFMIGDIINFGETKWGAKYHQALKQTGRAKSTLVAYASVARRIPAARRKAALSFSHHREIAKLIDVDHISQVLNDAAGQAETGEAPSVKQLRDAVATLMPAAKAKLAEAKQAEKAEIPERLRPKRKHKSLEHELTKKRLERDLMRSQKKILSDLLKIAAQLRLQGHEAVAGYAATGIDCADAIKQEFERISTTPTDDNSVDLQ